MKDRPFADKKVILFDWNRTLVDVSRSFDKAFVHVLEQYTARWDPPEGYDPETVLAAYKAEWRKQRRRAASLQEEMAINSLKTAFRDLPLPKDREGLAAIHRQIRREQQQRCTPLPGVLDLLRKLSKTRTLAVISNSEKVNPEKAGLGEWIPRERCFTAAQAGYRKPHSGIFLYALKKLKASPSECIMVGNSWRTDIRGAENARIDAVWLNRHAKKPLAFRSSRRIRIAVIRSLPRLLQLLDGS
jgi:putative hydrolase of the HAD superfamily